MNIRTPFSRRPSGRLTLFIIATQVILSAGNTFPRTIDDRFGDSESGALPVYTPADRFSLNSNCTACTVHPDPGGAFKGTWHDSTQLPGGPAVSVTLSFNGTAISVFCILANTTPSDFAFTLDGVPQKSFTPPPDNTSDFMYHQKVFDVSGLERGEHAVVMTTNNVGSLMLFDYATYIFDDGIAAAPVSTATVTNTVTSTPTAPVSGSKSSLISASSSATPVSSPSSTGSGSDTRSTSSPPQSPPPSSSPLSSSPSASSTSSTVQVRSKKQINLAPILAGTLIPIVLLILADTIMCRRQRARYAKVLEETRVHSPEAEWVQFHDPDLQGGRAAMGTREQGRNSRPDKVPRAVQRDPPAQASSLSVRGVPAMSRAPTFRTLDQVASPPPGYDSDFQQQQLLQLPQANNLPAPHP